MNHMKALVRKRYVIRQNILAIVGICLCFYFSYHALCGERSYIHLVSLESRLEKATAAYDQMHEQRVELERKVTMLRPNSIDPDLLEERARYVLGYTDPQDRVLLDMN